MASPTDPSLFRAHLLCDCCGFRCGTGLEIAKHAVRDGERVIVCANGRTTCPSCGSKNATYTTHPHDCGDQHERGLTRPAA